MSGGASLLRLLRDARAPGVGQPRKAPVAGGPHWHPRGRGGAARRARRPGARSLLRRRPPRGRYGGHRRFRSRGHRRRAPQPAHQRLRRHGATRRRICRARDDACAHRPMSPSCSGAPLIRCNPRVSCYASAPLTAWWAKASAPSARSSTAFARGEDPPRITRAEAASPALAARPLVRTSRPFSDERSRPARPTRA